MVAANGNRASLAAARTAASAAFVADRTKARLFYNMVVHELQIRNSKIVILDNDVILKRPLHGLVESLGYAIVGLVKEQEVGMQRLLNTSVFNGGVQVLDLPRMRNSTEYINELEAIAQRKRNLRGLERFGDQTIYSVLFKKHPALVKVLPCGWNRQIGGWRFDAHMRVTQQHGCSWCAVLHMNDVHTKLTIGDLYNKTNICRTLLKDKHLMMNAQPCISCSLQY